MRHVNLVGKPFMSVPNMFISAKALLLALTLSSCGDIAGTSTQPPTPSALPLEKRIIVEATIETGKKVQKRHQAAFGAWVAECSYSNIPSLNRKNSWCDVYAWTGVPPKRGDALKPLKDSAVVRFTDARPANMVLKTHKRQVGSLYSYQCGPSRFQDQHTKGDDKRFNASQALPFLGQMRTQDCTIQYRALGADEDTVTAYSAHGFREAYEYAKGYARVAG